MTVESAPANTVHSGEVDAEEASRMTPRLLLRVEGLVIAAAALVAYNWFGFPWWAFALLILAPDLAMLAYLRNPRDGARVYNIVHFTGAPALLLAASWYGEWMLGVQLALIWTAHIGVDRLFGYGLKYADSFKHTHLDNV